MVVEALYLPILANFRTPNGKIVGTITASVIVIGLF